MNDQPNPKPFTRIDAIVMAVSVVISLICVGFVSSKPDLSWATLSIASAVVGTVLGMCIHQDNGTNLWSEGLFGSLCGVIIILIYKLVTM